MVKYHRNDKENVTHCHFARSSRRYSACVLAVKFNWSEVNYVLQFPYSWSIHRYIYRRHLCKHSREKICSLISRAHTTVRWKVLRLVQPDFVFIIILCIIISNKLEEHYHKNVLKIIMETQYDIPRKMPNISSLNLFQSIERTDWN